MSDHRPRPSRDQASAPSETLCFGPFAFEVGPCRLTRDGIEVHLTPKAAAVLCLLLQRPGELIGKEEFLETVWEGVHVREESLTQAISVIRQTLGDSSQSPQYIQTVSGEGYRFVGEVAHDAKGVADGRPVPGATVSTGAPPPTFPPAPRDHDDRGNVDRRAARTVRHRAQSGSPSRRIRWMLTGAGLVLVGMASIAWLMAPADELEAEDPIAGNRIATDPITTPVTSFEGYERWPAISPDGKLVAFVAEGSHGGRRHLYVKQLNGGSQARQLTFGDTDHVAPAWSPDGDRIVFYRWSTGDPEVEILTITPLGTDETPVARFPDCISAVNGIDWSPDGEYLAYPACSEDGVPGIFLMSMDDGTVDQITFAPQEPHPSREVMPTFSPAGDAVAFIRLTNFGDDVVGVYIQAIAGGKAIGEPRPLETINERNMLVYDVGWTEDGQSLVWSAGDSYANTFLSVTSVASGDTRRLAAGARARHFSVVGNLLVYMWFQDDISIWRIGGPAADEPGVPQAWSPSSWDDDFPDYAPSGNAVAFTSDRGGTMDVYVADAEGGNLRKLTDLPFATNPEFSHDGQLIAFAAVIDEGGSRLYVIPAEGGFPRDLSEGNFREAGGGWSDDDEWIYHQSQRGGGSSYEIWRVRPDGSEREQVTEGGVLSPKPYGERVYFRRGGRIWSAAAGGGSEVLVLEERAVAWTLWNDKIVYMQPVAADGTEGSSTSHQRAVIKVYDLETHEAHEHATVTFAPGNWRRNGLTVSPDGRYILYYGREHAGSDLILVKNFR